MSAVEEQLHAFRAEIAKIRRERAEAEWERRTGVALDDEERRERYAPDPAVIRQNSGRVDYEYAEVQ